MGQALQRILLTIAVGLGLGATGAIFVTTSALAANAPASVHLTTDSDDDDDDDDGGAPRGGVDTGMGGAAGSGSAEDGSVPVVPLSLAGAGLFAVGAYWVRRAFFAGG
ncbi:hypothetical protein [Nonomuraea sp. NPDC049480]|uniref:hypothetical protein n=1 Tax=Nonomuraea sp. NPDC049480 TaxID=3364353 RepID=UPI0037B41536